jgi:hypothetical protein
MDRGKQVALAADAVSARHAADREVALRHMQRIGVQVMNVDMILFEILREARTADFKAIQPLLKGN